MLDALDEAENAHAMWNDANPQSAFAVLEWATSNDKAKRTIEKQAGLSEDVFVVLVATIFGRIDLLPVTLAERVIDMHLPGWAWTLYRRQAIRMGLLHVVPIGEEST